MAAVLEELRAQRAEPRPALRAQSPSASPRPRRRLDEAGAPASLVAAGGSPRSPSAPLPPRSASSGSARPLSCDHRQCPRRARRRRSTAAKQPRGAVPAAPALPPRDGGRVPRLAPDLARRPRPAACRTTRRGCACGSRRTTRLSQVAQRSISLTRGFGGYVTRSDVNVQGAKNGTADVDVHIPIARVQDAIARFSSLGVIVGQHVAVADLQASYDAAARRAESLRHSLALIEVRLADPKLTPEQRVALLGQRERARHALAGATQTTTDLSARGAYARIDLVVLDGREAGGRRPAARVSLHEALHRIGGILETGAIGALYAALLGGPLLVVAGLALLAPARASPPGRARAARPRLRRPGSPANRSRLAWPRVEPLSDERPRALCSAVPGPERPAGRPRRPARPPAARHGADRRRCCSCAAPATPTRSSAAWSRRSRSRAASAPVRRPARRPGRAGARADPARVPVPGLAGTARAVLAPARVGARAASCSPLRPAARCRRSAPASARSGRACCRPTGCARRPTRSRRGCRSSRS